MEEEVRILFVDDEESVLNAIKRLFLDEDYIILTALSGEEGLNILENENVQVVVSDYRMPVMNGIEFLEKVASRRPLTLRLILSGYADTSALIAAINIGHIYLFIPKPWNNDELKITIANALERYFLQKKNLQLTAELSAKNTELQALNNNLERLVEERTTELLEAREKLVQSEKMATIGMLSAGVAHEIKNPLAIIIQGIEFLGSCLPADETRSQVTDRIKKAAVRADRIVRGLLDFSRQTPVHLETADITAVLEETLSLMEHQLNLRNIKITRLFGDAATAINIDSQQINQVFTNILLNAAEAMPTGGDITIKLEAVEPEHAKKYLRLTFTDTGFGIPDNELKKLFDPFYSTKQKTGGVGLGLSVTRGIIEKHGGTIAVESVEGKGTSVVILLPY